MSVIYCYDCDKEIDLDFDCEHFEEHGHEGALITGRSMGKTDIINNKGVLTK